MKKVEALVRDNVRKMKGYDAEVRDAAVLLDANENAFPRSLGVARSSRRRGQWDLGGFRNLNRYPDARQAELKKAISAYAGVPPSNVVVGNGTNEIMDLVIKAFAAPGENIIILTPCFGMYKVFAEINGVEARSVPLDREFQPDVEGIKAAVDERTKIIFTCHPNNPSGNAIDRKRVMALLRLNAIVIADEEYVEFCGDSMVPLTRKFDNLLVLRSFSKAFGLAGIRVGYGVACKEVIQYLEKVKPPYNVNSISMQMAIGALKEKAWMEKHVRLLVKEREFLEKELGILGFRVFPSDSNFLLVRPPRGKKATALQRGLKRRGILVRDRSALFANSMRITVGTRKENKALLGAIIDAQKGTALQRTSA